VTTRARLSILGATAFARGAAHLTLNRNGDGGATHGIGEGYLDFEFVVGAAPWLLSRPRGTPAAKKLTEDIPEVLESARGSGEIAEIYLDTAGIAPR
jgi:hypothetical protein